MQPAADKLPLVLIENDLAAVLRCSVRTVQRMKRARTLPAPLPIAGRPRWARDDVLRWLGGGAARRRGSAVKRAEVGR